MDEEKLEATTIGNALPDQPASVRPSGEAAQKETGAPVHDGEQVTLPPPAATLPPMEKLPALFGAYELLAELDRGGMGVVYRARDLSLGRTVALKMLIGGRFSHQEDLNRFTREAQAAAQLRHPNIVEIYEISHFQGLHYYTMEFVPGGSLARQMDRFRDPRAAAALVAKVAEAVHSAHDNGVLHRDLKPGNILIDDRGEPLVSDFGLAKLLATDANLTRTGDMLGTPAYMAPEQAAGQTSNIGVHSDVWALGVILYEALTGVRPFRGETAEAVYRAVRESDPVRPRRVKPEIPRDLETIVLKCLEKEPGRRYKTAREVGEELANWLRGESIRAQPPLIFGKLARACKHSRFFRFAGFSLVTGVAVATAMMTYTREEPANKLALPAEGSAGDLAVLQSELKSKGQVQLLSTKGLPRWFRPRTGKEQLEIHGHDETLTVVSMSSLGTIELLPDPIVQEYSFRAEVRHIGDDDRDNGNNVGLFAFASERATRQGWENAFVALTFQERGRSRPRDSDGRSLGEVTFACFRRFETGLFGGHTHPFATETFPPVDRSWRQLELRITGGRIQAYWMGKPLFRDNRAKILEEAKQKVSISNLLRPDGPVIPQAGIEAEAIADEGKQHFGFREILGLYVQNGSAQFRNVIVEVLR